MSEHQIFEGLACPSCGNSNPIPEGAHIVICSSCHLRFIVRDEAGVTRYQLALNVRREDALEQWQRFLSSSTAINHKARRVAKISEVFLVHIPFWRISGKVLRLDTGKNRISSGQNAGPTSQEEHLEEKTTWNRAACDVREFGVNRLEISDQPIRPFEVEEVHRSGMVFEPVESADEALAAAQAALEANLGKKGKLFVRIVNVELSLVYYPLYVVRYVALGRVYQVVVDGNSGDVLHGRAPGNVVYRAAALVLGFLLGAITAIDLPVLFFYKRENVPIFLLGLILLAGLFIMFTGWRVFRLGEYYEYQRDKPPELKSVKFEIGLPREAREFLDRLAHKGKFK